MNTNRSKSILTMPLKLIVVLSAVMSISTGAFAQDTTMQYLRNTPVTLWTLGMMKLNLKLMEVAQTTYWPKMIFTPSAHYDDTTEEFKIYFIGATHDTIEQATENCKRAIHDIKIKACVDDKGVPFCGDRSAFSRLFFPMEFENLPKNYKVLQADLDKRFNIKCMVNVNNADPVHLQSNLMSPNILQVIQ